MAAVPIFMATSWATLIRRIILRRAVPVLRHRDWLAVEDGQGDVLGDRTHSFIWTKTADDILDGITVKGFQRRTTNRLRL
jgi:hypothetical protein